MCLTLDAGQLPRSIAPGATCRIEVAIALNSFPDEGTVEQSFNAYFSGYPNPLKVTLSGMTTLPLPKVIDFGAFAGSTSKDTELRGIAQKNGLRISDIACSDHRVRTSILTPTAFRITVDPIPTGEPIEAFADVAFYGASIAKQRVSIRGMASGGLLVHPNPLVFGYVRISDGPFTKGVCIDSEDGKPFTLDVFSFDQRLFSLKTVAVSDIRTICHITVRPQEPGALDEVVKLMTLDGRRGVSIRCTGMVQ